MDAMYHGKLLLDTCGYHNFVIPRPMYYSCTIFLRYFLSTSLHSLKDVTIIHDTSYYHSNLIKKIKKRRKSIKSFHPSHPLEIFFIHSPIQIEMQTERKRNRGIIMRVHNLRPLKFQTPSTDEIELWSLMKRFSRNKGCSIIRTLYTIVNRSPSCVNMQHGAARLLQHARTFAMNSWWLISVILLRLVAETANPS